VVTPFYNEEAYLAATLCSLRDQTLRPRFILVDNASTDASGEIAKRFARDNPELSVSIVSEPVPGKASALAHGISLVETEFVATTDADTWYPRDYLERADALFRAGGPAGAATLAFGAPADAQERQSVVAKGALVAKLMPRQAHSGGYGQSFRTEALKGAGSFSPERWPYCLMDHEIMHRITKMGGRLLYSADHWCVPSPRRSNRKNVRWTLPERLLYHIVPFSRRDWFFYDFLANRFDARGLGELALRRKEWDPSA
jgi:glycosyltransferase involved in cell wall biosynthesis